MGQGSARPILRSLGLLALCGALTDCGAPEPLAPPASVSTSTPAARPAPEAIDLGGPWQVWLDRDAVGLRDDWVAALSAGRRPASAPAAPLLLAVPGPLEADATTLDYDGIAFYARSFETPADLGSVRAALCFDQVNYACRVWLDGTPVGEHEGGYESFSFDLTGRLRPDSTHVLVVRVVDPGAAAIDGLSLGTTPHAKESWYENFGGLLGPVTLRLMRGWSLRDGSLRTDVEAEVGRERVVLRGELLPPPAASGAAPAPRNVTLTATIGPADATQPSGSVALEVALTGESTPFQVTVTQRGARRWSPDSPTLYRVALSVGGELVAERMVGFRTLSIEGGDFLIDGVRRTLKGVLWQPHYTGTGGVTPPAETLQATARAIKAAGFDLVRAHVRPAPPAFLDEADRIGLLVLEEPAIGWVDDDPLLLERMERELSWMVERDRHHPSIVLWGVLNELSGRAYRYADALVERVAQLDPTRPVLEDSGAFLGQGHVRPPGAEDSVPMIDRHAYPPYPLPIEERDALLELREPGGGLVFVSEFGHGTLLDADATLKPFTDAGRMTAERIKFASWAAFARRARQPGATPPGTKPLPWWFVTSPEAADVQAQAAEDMLGVLRANPDLDLLCYTQWQAVSEESSAGLLDPFGGERLALEAARRALRPLTVVTLPEQLSVLPGGEIRCQIAVVNDTGAPVSDLDVECMVLDASNHRSILHSEQWRSDVPSGVTLREVSCTAPASPGLVCVVASLTQGAHKESDSTSSCVRVAAAPSPQGGIRTWSLAGDATARDFVQRWGFEETPPGAAVDVALIGDPERLRAAMPLGDWLRLWAGIYRGGAAIVLVPGPAATEERKALGMLRGVQTHTSLPLPVSIASAPGNFMARVQVERQEIGPPERRLLGRGDEAFSPEGMLVDPPPGSDERLVTLGWLGNRVGAPDVVLPFGRGTIRVVGLPLLRPAKGAVDPSRDERLARLVREAAAEARVRLEVPDAAAIAPAAPWSPPSAADLERLQTWLDRLDRLVSLGDRQSPFTGAEPRLPETIAAALDARTAALEALFDGDTARGLELLETAVAPLWTEAAQRFLDREAQVLEAWSSRVAAGGEANWDSAYDVRQAWVAAVSDWFRGAVDPAQAGIDRAWELLQDR